MKSANETYTGKWAGKKYSSVPDSIISVSSSEKKAYYNSPKDKFRKTPSRTISYVVFEVAPTDDDLLAIEKTATEVGKEFAATDELKSFVRANRNGKIADNYVSAAQLSEEEAAALMAGETYGPVLKNNEWTMARALDTKMVPDSMGIRHIVLPYTEDTLADSLLTALRGGADFAQAASQYSVYDMTAANGGEVGVMPFSAFSGEFAEALAGAKEGDIVKIASGDAIQLMQVYRTGKPTKHVQVASITYPVEASAATRRNAHNLAGTFSVNAKGSVEAFNNAASEAAGTPRVASLAQGERTIRGLEDSREVARWAYGAETGDLSEIFTVGNDYVVATDERESKQLAETEHYEVLNALEEQFQYPMFVKPAGTGSSVGVSKVKNREELIAALETAAQYDRKILVEEFIHGREIEVAVMGNDSPVASICGEIDSGAEFYDYEAKYVTDTSRAYIPARISEETEEAVRDAAVRIYQAIGCQGLSRVDFFVTYEGEDVIFNEINTLPGFTSISMYPKLFAASGIPYPELIDQLIALACEAQAS